jgi:hypothetical protein
MDEKPDEKEFRLAAWRQAATALDALRRQQAAGITVEWATIWLHASTAAEHARALSRLWAEEAERLHRIADGALPVE